MAVRTRRHVPQDRARRGLGDVAEPPGDQGDRVVGQVVGDEFFFIANSHWNRFDRDGNLPDDLEGPVVLKVKLGETP